MQPTATAPPPAKTQDAQRAPQQPSPCRMVLFNGHGHPVPAATPAVIRKVNDDGTIDLTVFGEKGCIPYSGIRQGTAVGQWNWPPRV